MNIILLDKSALTDWQEVDSIRWKSIIVQLTTLFFEATLEQEKIIKKSWQEKNFDALARSAHLLKSSCGNVGANLAFAILDSIERNAKENKIEDMENLITSLELVLNDSRKAVFNFVGQLQAA